MDARDTDDRQRHSPGTTTQDKGVGDKKHKHQHNRDNTKQPTNATIGQEKIHSTHGAPGDKLTNPTYKQAIQLANQTAGKKTQGFYIHRPIEYLIATDQLTHCTTKSYAHCDHGASLFVACLIACYPVLNSLRCFWFPGLLGSMTPRINY